MFSMCVLNIQKEKGKENYEPGMPSGMRGWLSGQYPNFSHSHQTRGRGWNLSKNHKSISPPCYLWTLKFPAGRLLPWTRLFESCTKCHWLWSWSSPEAPVCIIHSQRRMWAQTCCLRQGKEAVAGRGSYSRTLHCLFPSMTGICWGSLLALHSHLGSGTQALAAAWGAG